MPQLCAISVALEAQGETVPRRGVTTIRLPSLPAPKGFAVGQQCGQPLPFRRIGSVIGGHQVHEPSRHPADLVVDGLEPGKQLLDSKFAEGAAALELGDVQGHCETCVDRGWIAGAADWGPASSRHSTCAVFVPLG